MEKDELLTKNKELFRKLTGTDSIMKIGIPDELQQLFHFLLLTDEADWGNTLETCVPNPNDVAKNDLDDGSRIFMEYAGLDKGAYHE
jgi:hypothetical protein